MQRMIQSFSSYGLRQLFMLSLLTILPATAFPFTDAANDAEIVQVSGQSNKSLDTPVGTETFTVNGVSFTMVYVEGGTFWMGSSRDNEIESNNTEQPRHQVTLSSFSIGQTEVTQELWMAVMGSNPSCFKGSNRPVEDVSWDSCQQFITNLNELTGRTFRLPTEAEWEYAARGGKNGHGYKYAGSNIINDVAWYFGNSQYNATNAVGTKAPNELGLYDMSGNVWEWCQDWFRISYYRNSPTKNPCNTVPTRTRVARGGGALSPKDHCRVANRNSLVPGCNYNQTGLRLAL